MNAVLKPKAVIDDSPRATMQRTLVDAGLDDETAAAYAAMLCEAFKGELVYFAASAWHSRQERDAEIRARRRAGMSIRALAAEYLLSKSAVFDILRADVAATQADQVVTRLMRR